MRPALAHAILDILDGIGFEDRDLWKRRQALISQAGLDEATIVATVGVLQICQVCFYANRFDVAIEGTGSEPAVIIGALDECERLIDLVAWPIDRPTEMATLGGPISMLNERQAWAHPMATITTPLRVHRTALAWVLARFDGCVPLDHQQAARTFLDIGGDLVVEDDQHGVQLDEARRIMAVASFNILVRGAA